MHGLLKQRKLRTLAILFTVVRAVLPQQRPEVQPTRLIIRTQPGSQIYLDKRSRGRIDREGSLILDKVTPGSHVLRVEFSGKQPYTNSVRVPANRTTSFRVDLLDYTGDLEVYTTPEAELTLDGKPVGEADASGRLLLPKVIASRSYRLHGSRTGYNPAERELRLAPGVLNTITLDLLPVEVPIQPAQSSPPSYRQERTLGLGTNRIGQLIDPNGILFTADNRLVGWGSKDIAVWEPGTGRQLRNVSIRHGLDLLGVSRNMAWCALRDRVPVAGQREEKHVTLLLDLESRNVVQQHPGYYVMAFSPDSGRVVIRDPDERSSTLYEVKSGKVLHRWSEYDMDRFTFSPDGRWLASSAEGGVTIRDTETGLPLQKLPAEGITALRFSPDGKWLAVFGFRKLRLTSGDAGIISLWESVSGKRGRTIETKESPVDGVFTSDSGRILMLTGNAIQTWNLATGKRENEWPLRNARRIRLSQDDTWMAVLGEHLTLWRRE